MKKNSNDSKEFEISGSSDTFDHDHEILDQILAQVTENSKVLRPSLMVFDLDSTLFDVRPRIRQVLKEFLRQDQIRSIYPNDFKALESLEIHQKDWGIRGALQRTGLVNHNPELGKIIKEFWLESFFSDEFLHFDEPYEGSVEYVDKLINAGAQIAFLTGRDWKRMGKGTVEVLQKWGFPYQDQTVTLALKPHQGEDDALFKSNWFKKLVNEPKAPAGAALAGKPETPAKQDIWFFENEPVNISLVRKEHPHVKIVFFDSTHSGKETAPKDLPVIQHYKISRD